MLAVRLIVSFSVAVALAAPAAWAQESQAPGVEVAYGYPALTLRVSQPSDLQIVLEAICQRTETSCEIAAAAAQVVVEPVVLSGSWDQVIAKLFEGTNLGYAWVTPVPGRPGRLLVLLKSAALSASSQTAAENNEERRRRLVQQAEVPELNSGQQNASDRVLPTEVASSPDRSSQGSEAVGFEPSGAAERRAVQQQPNENTPNPAQVEAQEFAVWSIIAGQDANTPASTPGTVTLPVPDLNGNPILAPTTGQGLTEAPFPDPAGQPIPITPLAPGQHALNPFGLPIPSTYPAGAK